RKYNTWPLNLKCSPRVVFETSPYPLTMPEIGSSLHGLWENRKQPITFRIACNPSGRQGCRLYPHPTLPSMLAVRKGTQPKSSPSPCPLAARLSNTNGTGALCSHCRNSSHQPDSVSLKIGLAESKVRLRDRFCFHRIFIFACIFACYAFTASFMRG